jgi:hypothetical protein
MNKRKRNLFFIPHPSSLIPCFFLYTGAASAVNSVLLEKGKAKRRGIFVEALFERACAAGSAASIKVWQNEGETESAGRSE